MNAGDPLMADVIELRAQAHVLDRSRLVLHGAATDLRAPGHDVSDDELAALIERAAQVLAGAADGIADSLNDLTAYVLAHADQVAGEAP